MRATPCASPQLWRKVDGKHACLVGSGGECAEVFEDSPLPSSLAADPLLSEFAMLAIGRAGRGWTTCSRAAFIGNEWFGRHHFRGASCASHVADM